MPVVALTARVMETTREKCVDAGMDGYLAKTFEPSELREVLNEVEPRSGPERPVGESRRRLGDVSSNDKTADNGS